MSTKFTFGAAITHLKNGLRVQRSGWNGKGMFLYYVPANVYPTQTEVAKRSFGDSVQYGAYIAMCTAQGNVVPWLSSQTDMLAYDWCIVSGDEDNELGNRVSNKKIVHKRFETIDKDGLFVTYCFLTTIDGQTILGCSLFNGDRKNFNRDSERAMALKDASDNSIEFCIKSTEVSIAEDIINGRLDR